MNPKNEKRCERRSGCEAEVEWGYFNRSQCIDGRLLNVSPGGVCLESPLEVTGRCTLSIRLKRCSPQSYETKSGEGLRSAGLADVKWCCSLSKTEKAARYAIGLKYIHTDNVMY